MIIEVIPFFHIMAADIVRMLGEENSHQIIATVMVAFALSSILTGVFPPRFFLSCYPFLWTILIFSAWLGIGITFIVFGVLELGSVIGFFPRHILVGYVTVVHNPLS
jgi:SulP family sulfate permease